MTINIGFIMKLFCFPYAGGSAAVFSKWNSLIGTDIEIIAIELAGRGKRIHEPAYYNFEHVLSDVFSLIADEINSGPYAFFGHSMGAKIAFWLTQKIKILGHHPPAHLFISGRGAPFIFGTADKRIDQLSDTEFREEILRLGGTPEELFDHPELVQLFLPLLRNDFRLAAREAIKKPTFPLDCEISVFTGYDEELTDEQLNGWAKYTYRKCSIYHFQGGHFFINKKTEAVVEKIKEILNNNC